MKKLKYIVCLGLVIVMAISSVACKKIRKRKIRT